MVLELGMLLLFILIIKFCLLTNFMTNPSNNIFHGSVPEGEYQASLSPEQVAALQLSREIAEKLIIEHPEVAELYEQGLSHMEIAELIIPNSVRKYPEVAKKAVGYAVRRILSPEKQEKLTRDHRRRTLSDAIGDRMSPENREIWRGAQATRTRIYGAATTAMIEGRGETPWSDDEKNTLRELLQDENYKKGNGSPDYANIAQCLNNSYHNGEIVRREKSVGNYVRDLRRRENKKYARA